MIFQDEIWSISLVGMGLVTLGFIYVVLQAGKPADATEAERAHKASDVLRRWLFLALLVLGIVVAYISLRKFPIPLQHTPLQANQVVNVVGHEWSWELSTNQIEVNVPIEFRVTSADVNHGFAIYAPSGRIVIQTQAMPGYTNTILYTFDEPGTYTIRCLEYCGIAHHVMAAEFNVAVTNGGHVS